MLQTSIGDIHCRDGWRLRRRSPWGIQLWQLDDRTANRGLTPKGSQRSGQAFVGLTPSV